MSFANWSRRTSTPASGGGFGSAGGWGLGLQPSWEQKKDETLFSSLFPISGMVSGEQVKPVFSASRLSQAKLAQIWNMVDKDHDGRINLSEFCAAMNLIRQAQQQEGGLLGSSQGVQFFQREPAARQQSLGLFPSVPSSDVSSSWSMPAVNTLQQPTPSALPPSSTAMGTGGIGRSVSLNVVAEGWAMKPQDKRKYLMEFNTHDRTKSGYLAGADVRLLLTKSNLDQSTLAQIWDLSDADKDGRLSADEFSVAMHLIEKAKSGLVLPKTLPEELKSTPTKFNTVERRRKNSEDTIEDKRKENFEMGRMELERRRRARQEQLEKEKAEKERKRREEEERRLQQEREAEIARQAELERQRRKALEIERERELQMQKLAMQREQEQRDLERRRKEEWARRRQLELEGQREWEKKSLRSMQAQDSELEEELRQLDQKKLVLSSRLDRQKSLCTELSNTLRSLRLSNDIRQAELTKLQNELHGFQLQLSSLEQNRRELQETLQVHRPEVASYQRHRQQLRDGIFGLAASLAGLRSSLNSNTENRGKQQAQLSKQSKTLEELRSTLQPEEVKVRDLQLLVGMRRRTWEETQRKVREAEERRRAQERQQWEERERLQQMVEEKAQREARLERIRHEQEEALQKERERKASEEVEAAISAVKEPPAVLMGRQELTEALTSPVFVADRRGEEMLVIKEELPTPPPQPTKREVKEKDKEVLQKVKELQKRKAELQKRRDQSREEILDSPTKKKPPVRPIPYALRSKLQVKERDKAKDRQKVVQEATLGPPLLDLASSWDSSAQKTSISAFSTEVSEILQPLRVSEEVQQEPSLADVEESKSPVFETEPSQRLASIRQVFEQALSTQEEVQQQELSLADVEESKSPVFEAEPSQHVASIRQVFEQALSTQENSSVEALYSTVQKRPAATQENSSVEALYSTVQKRPAATQENSSVEALYSTVQKRPAATQENSSVEALYSTVQKRPAATQENSSVEALYSTVQRRPAATRQEHGSSSSMEVTAESRLEEAASPQVTSSATSAAPVQYRALYDFDASDSVEVSCCEGDILTLCPDDKASAGWLVVEVRGRKGWVPQSYLQLVDGVGGGEGGRQKEEERVGEIQEEQPRVIQDSPPLVRARVIFSWTGSKDNHLPIQRGEVVTVLKQSEKWWSGEAGGKVGWFPKTFVRILTEEEEAVPPPPSATITPDPQPPPPPHSTPMTEDPFPPPAREHIHSPPPPGEESKMAATYEAVYDYNGEAEGDLSFVAGDIIRVVKQDGEWWTGILNSVEGVFPSNYVQLKHRSPSPISSITSMKTVSSETSSVIVHSKPLIARVTVAFQEQKDGQLSLQPGEYIRVHKQAGSGWWQGELQSRGKQRKAGWFPANRVELLSRLHSTSDLSRAKSPLLDVLEPQPKLSSQNLVLALYTYTAQSADELSFHKGSVLTVLSKDGEWWRGELNGQVGLFPSNYVQPLTEQAPSEATRWADSVRPDVLAAVSDQERKRQEAIFELLSSERNYVDSLKLVKEVFFDPLARSEVLSEEELSKVLVNWNELLQCNTDLLNAFLVRLRTSGAVVRNIGDILLNQIPILQPHIRWCSCQLTACTLLQQKASDPQFKDFEQKCTQDPRTGGLPLSSFLLKPMQRVTKYPLLIKRILDYTAEGDMDYDELKASLEQLEMLCTQVNEAVRSKENTEQLEWLQTHVQFTLDENLVFNSQTNFMGSRKLLHWGKLFKIRGSKDLVGFLFNDFFLLVKPKVFFHRAATPADLDPFGKNEFQMYRKPFLLEGIRIKMPSPDHYGPSVFLLMHTSEEKEIPLRAESDNDRDQWMKKITRACLEYMQTKKKQERERKEKQMRTLKDSVGRLKVTVVEAADLQATDPNGRSDPFCVVKLGDVQEHITDVRPATLNPKWNHKMLFEVHDLNKDVLEITVFDKDLFSPNDFLGCTRLALKDLLSSGDCPWTKRLLLEDVKKGEIELRIELELNKSDLLL